MLSFISQSQILSSPVCPEGIYLSSCLFKRMESERHCLIVTHSIYNVLALFRQIQFFLLILVFYLFGGILTLISEEISLWTILSLWIWQKSFVIFPPLLKVCVLFIPWLSSISLHFPFPCLASDKLSLVIVILALQQNNSTPPAHPLPPQSFPHGLFSAYSIWLYSWCWFHKWESYLPVDLLT